ncbi:glycosyltransferase family 2 protein [Patescibacteria group bacterium]|nr:glycosyltransferase family 2 protein [Patescibacteria group bacterium]MBU1952092.1 glycosyltransferase family 2 protein [Patescibacteria group bacterium]
MNTAPKETELSILIVNWNCRDIIIKCLESLIQTINRHSYEIIVVDNNSADGSPELIENKYSHIKLIRNNSNNYFAGGNNQAYKASKGKYILLLNPDIIVPEGSIDRLLDFMMQKNQQVMTGKLINLDGTVQNTMYRSFPSAFTLLATGLSRQLSILRLLPNVKAYLSLNKDFQKDFYIEQAPGAVIIMNRKLIDKLQYLFDERNFPLFYNDVDLSYRIEKLGKKILYKADIPFYHIKQQSLNKLDFYNYSRNYCISSLKFFRKHKLYFDYIVLKVGFFVRFIVHLLISFLQLVFGKIKRIEFNRRRVIIKNILAEKF